jgi:hypothetical protein
MSLADQASLLLIPSGYKSQKVYSIFPTDGDGDFDFSRSGSATRIAKNGLITTVDSNIPRLEYPMIDGVQKGCPSLILEPQRTNIFQRSEEFSNAYWNISRIETPYIADVVSPDGTLNAYTLEISNGETNGGGVYRSGISISGDNSWSVFAKKKTANYLVLADTGTTTNAAYFDLENGTVGTTYNATGEMQDFGNGWYRCTMKYTLTSSGIKFIYLSNLDGATNGGVVGGDSIYIYGAQLEQGSFQTSYIKSNGSATTRQAETCNGAGDAATFNDSEGVLMAEISALADDGTNRQSALSDNSSSDRVMINLHATSNQIQGYITNNVGEQADMRYIVADSTLFNKVAVKYKLNDCALWVNGFEVATDTSATMPSSLQVYDFDNYGGSLPFYGKVKQLQYYNSALTDSELEKISSWTSFTDMAEGQLYTIE